MEDIPPLTGRSTAVCARCEAVLETTIGRSSNLTLVCSIATLLLLIPVNALPLLRVDLLGQHSESPFAAGVVQLWRRGWVLLAGLTALFVIVLPLLRFAILSAVLGALRIGRRPPWLGRAFRWAMWLDPWALPDVFLLAVCVGYFYLTVIEGVRASIQTGGECLIAAGILTLIARAALDQRAVWRAIRGESEDGFRTRMIGCTTCDLIQPMSREGHACPRCGARILARKPDALAWAGALLAASFVLIFPANIYPVNVSTLLGHQVGLTNLGYVEQLWQRGLPLLSAVTFWTSVLGPGVQILALGWCVLTVCRRSGSRLLLKTKTLRVIAESQRWSQTGPFAVVYFVPLIDFGRLGAEAADWGATAFMLMSVMTMAAVIVFDPRRMWDAGEGSAL